MKKLSLFFTGLFFLVLSLYASAQTKPPAHYFVGKWDVVVEGTPSGDGKMTVTLERKEGKLGGTISTKEGTEPAKFTRVEEKEKSVKVNFTAHGYDDYLLMEKKDDDNVTGNMMDMFDARGVRIKEKETKKS